jgi:hypothetical protein
MSKGPCFTGKPGTHSKRKQLTSSGLFHTPGIFRALQNDYRIRGATRRRAITILSDGYNLPYDEAEGLLRGVIAAEIDEAAGTITYTIDVPQDDCANHGSSPTEHGGSMTNIYNVHIYREMRLVFGGIAADTPEAAATIAYDKPTDEADSIDDCDGETLSALVDLQGDEEYEQSRIIDFDNERLRKAVPELLASLEAILPYAENEAYTLEKLNSPEAEAESERAWKAVEAAQAAISEATASSPPSGASGHLSIIDILPRLWAIRDDIFWQEDTCGIDITAKAELDALITDVAQSTRTPPITHDTLRAKHHAIAQATDAAAEDDHK